MLRVIVPATKWAPPKEESHRLNRNATTTLGSCAICDIKVDRQSIDDVHLIIRYNSAAAPQQEEILIRDNRSQSGTFLVNKGEALSHRTFNKFQLTDKEPIKLELGDIAVEITQDATEQQLQQQP